MASEADHLVGELQELASPTELAKLRRRLPPGEEAFGMRMRDLFDAARAHRDIPLATVDALLEHPAYEPRMAAICILDFKARRKLSEAERAELYALYLRRHDRITAWDMVDRAAPRVVGGYLAGRSLAPLEELAGRRAAAAAYGDHRTAVLHRPGQRRGHGRRLRPRPTARRGSRTRRAQRCRDLPEARRPATAGGTGRHS